MLAQDLHPFLLPATILFPACEISHSSLAQIRRCAMTEKLILIVKNENGTYQELSFEQPMKCLVGRSKESKWHLDSPFVSRRHCMFEIDPPYASVNDLGSLNGTFVNGQRIEGEYDLADGDVIQVGKTLWSVHMENPAYIDANVPELESLEV
jgi:pSer/pThr/pTyr-binding forkhead associated (FHA) protein